MRFCRFVGLTLCGLLLPCASLLAWHHKHHQYRSPVYGYGAPAYSGVPMVGAPVYSTPSYGAAAPWYGGCSGSAAPSYSYAPSYGYGYAAPSYGGCSGGAAAPGYYYGGYGGGQQAMPVQLWWMLFSKVIDRGLDRFGGGDGASSDVAKRLNALESDVKELKAAVEKLDPKSIDERLDKLEKELDNWRIKTKKELQKQFDDLKKNLGGTQASEVVDRPSHDIKKATPTFETNYSSSVNIDARVDEQLNQAKKLVSSLNE